MKRLLYRVYTFLKEHASSSCQFFDGFGIMIQTCLFTICVFALIFKRYIENPQRPWSIWFFDTLKQMIGQGTQHCANLIIARKIGENSGMECEWYLNNLISDCCLGVLFCFLYLQALIYLLTGTRFEFKTGDYGQGGQNKEEKDEEENSTTSFHHSWKYLSVLYQICWWIIIVLLAKLTTVGILYSFYKIFEDVGGILLTPVKTNPKLKLVCVMIIFPTVFNIIQFWFTDNFIKINSEIDEDGKVKEQQIAKPSVSQSESEILLKIDNKNIPTGYTPIPQIEHNYNT